jgi:hypothetical protein
MSNMNDLKEMYPGDEELREYLQGNAYSVDEGQHYLLPLSQEEIETKKDHLAENMIELTKMKDELEAIKADFKARIQPVEKDIEIIVEVIKTGKEPRVGTLYLMADHSSGNMYMYNEDGRLVYERPLTKNEKQLKIHA